MIMGGVPSFEIPAEWNKRVWAIIHDLNICPEKIVIHRIEEKFGGLRIYIGSDNPADPYPELAGKIIDDHINKYEWH